MPDAPNRAGVRKIGIYGVWYDISELIAVHPGGDVIRGYINKDATVVFKLWHKQSDLLQRYSHLMKKVGSYKMEMDELDQKILKLNQKLIQNGDYKTDYSWLISKLTFTLFIFWFSFKASFIFITAVLFAFGWQQCGFLMHDAMHGLLVEDKKSCNHFLGWLFGSVLFGINANFWHKEHNIHHVYTNTIDDANEYITDPQMHEIMWMNTNKAFSLRGSTYKMGMLQDCMITYQKYIFLPVCVLFGRIGIFIDSWKDERNSFHLCGLAFHHMFLFCFYFFSESFESKWEFGIFYFIASLFQGILTLQLLVSHYDKPFEHKSKHIKMGWFKRQCSAVKDIENQPWFDWFYGGLNFHLVHHTFPKLPRYKYRKVDKMIRQILKETDIEIDAVTFKQSIIDTIEHLGKVAKEFGVWKAVKEFHIE